MAKARTIISVCVAALVAVYLVAVVIVSSTYPIDTVCHHLRITIRDWDERQYVTPEELQEQLRRQGLFPIGQSVTDISTQRIEWSVRKNDMVRNAECYLLPQGDVCIELTQRVPLLRVVTAAEAYLIDTDRLRMPIRPNMDLDILTANGNVGQRMAENELAELATWLQQEDYWRPRIARIYVRAPYDVALVLKEDGALILLGEVAGYKQKMHKLRTLEKNLRELNEPPHYREYDLRFEGQVVTR